MMHKIPSVEKSVFYFKTKSQYFHFNFAITCQYLTLATIHIVLFTCKSFILASSRSLLFRSIITYGLSKQCRIQKFYRENVYCPFIHRIRVNYYGMVIVNGGELKCEKKIIILYFTIKSDSQINSDFWMWDTK